MMEQNLKIVSFRVNGMARQSGADERKLHLSLRTEGAAEFAEFRLWAEDSLCWTSGTLPMTHSCTFADLPLEPCSVYRVEAVVFGGGQEAKEEITLFTGMMDRPWQGKWIEPEQENGIRERDILFFEQFVPMPDHFGGHDRLRPVQELRRVFTVEGQPKQALFYASAHGVYDLYLNGRRVDSRRLAPETTPYESMLYYQVYDMTHLLVEGENTLQVLLADGWWIGRIGLTGHSCQYGERLAFLGQLEVDGKTLLATDGQFESRPSSARYSDLMMGEKWDMSAPDAPWTPCVPVGEGDATLRIQCVDPVDDLEILEPVSLFTAPNGELVADFGRCLAGVADIRLSCPAGRVVTLDHSETLDPEGNFFRNILGRNKDQQDVVVCGEGETRFCPRFTYHGFRYVRLSGVTREQVKSVCAKIIGTPLDRLGDFSCSHEGLTRLQGNILRSMQSNMVSVPTDCPQREKVGWTGDLQVFADTGCFNCDLGGFLSAWLGQMRLCQEENGSVPIVIPSYPEQTKMQLKTNGWNSSAAWSDACVLVPLALYRAYGDTQVLRDNLPMMERWMDYIESASHDDIWSDGYHFGDWLIPSFENDIEGGTAATAPVIAACQYAVTTAALIEVLEALDESADKIETYRALLANIRKAVREKFIREDGFVEGDLQGLYVMALYSGAAAGELGQRVADRLAAKIEANGCALDTGFVSTPHLLDVLTEYGHKDLAWKLLYRTESPSWLYQVEKGATTIWENWNAIRPDGTVTTSSYNHYALGSVGDWIYRHIGGLNRVGAGWREIEFAPDLACGLEWAACSHITPYGLASCRWQKVEQGTQVDITVPHGVKAWVRLPGLKQELTAGNHSFTV